MAICEFLFSLQSSRLTQTPTELSLYFLPNPERSGDLRSTNFLRTLSSQFGNEGTEAAFLSVSKIEAMLGNLDAGWILPYLVGTGGVEAWEFKYNQQARATESLWAFVSLAHSQKGNLAILIGLTHQTGVSLSLVHLLARSARQHPSSRFHRFLRSSKSSKRSLSSCNLSSCLLPSLE